MKELVDLLTSTLGRGPQAEGGAAVFQSAKDNSRRGIRQLLGCVPGVGDRSRGPATGGGWAACRGPAAHGRQRRTIATISRFSKLVLTPRTTEVVLIMDS